MSVRTVTFVDCDRCEAIGTGEHLGPFNLGEGSRMIDLCPACRAELLVDKLIETAITLGEATDVAPTTRAPAVRRSSRVRNPMPPSAAPTLCPVCHESFSGRGATINHVASRHDMTIVEASHVVRPEGPTGECSYCGWLGTAGSGISRHEASCPEAPAPPV